MQNRSCDRCYQFLLTYQLNVCHEGSHHMCNLRNLHAHWQTNTTNTWISTLPYPAPPTRSPVCHLIAAEDLWALLDALQELVPVEVHQHWENINTSITPLVVRS